MSDYTPEHRAETEGNEPLVGDAPPQAATLFSNKVYDRLKWVSFVLLPALGAAYFALAQLLELPYGVEVLGVLAILDTLLGTLLGKSNKDYQNSEARFDGAILISPGEDAEGRPATDLNVSLDRAAVANKDAVLVKVKRV